MKVPFHKPIAPKNVNLILKKSLDSGWLTTGPIVKEFEAELSKYVGFKYVVAVNSCTAALHLVLAAKGISRGDFFIVPTYTFVASVEVGEYLGAKPIFVDSDPISFNIDLDEVEKILSSNKYQNIKAIIPVHFAGQLVDNERINKIAEKYNLFILEDAAHALEAVGNRIENHKSMNSVAFSFYANKNITTGGEGGAIATNDKFLANNVRKLSLHGMDKDGWKRFDSKGKWSYDVSELGYKYNMTDISAALGLDQFRNINKWHKIRCGYSSYYNKSFINIDGMILPKHKYGDIHSWHLYIVKIKAEKWNISRNKIIDEINKKGIGTSVHYIPVHMHSYYIKKYKIKTNFLPNSKSLSESVISLPLYPGLKINQVKYIVDVIKNIWEKYKK